MQAYFEKLLGFFLNLHISFPGRRFKMKSLKDILAVLVGIASAIGAIYFFYKFVTEPPAAGHTSGWIALGLAAVAFVCGLIYFLGHVNKEEEIHITQ
jgi:4-hydroxybenzoate polyprenyltransferase